MERLLIVDPKGEDVRQLGTADAGSEAKALPKGRTARCISPLQPLA